MAQELYPDAKTLLDLFGEPTNLRRMPYYHIMPIKEKTAIESEKGYLDIIGDLTSLFVDHRSATQLA